MTQTDVRYFWGTLTSPTYSYGIQEFNETPVENHFLRNSIWNCQFITYLKTATLFRNGGVLLYYPNAQHSLLPLLNFMSNNILKKLVLSINLKYDWTTSFDVAVATFVAVVDKIHDFVTNEKDGLMNRDYIWLARIVQNAEVFKFLLMGRQ